MKRYLVTYNECGERKAIEVESECDTLETFIEAIDNCMECGCYFIILNTVTESMRTDIGIKPENIESIVELKDEL